MMMTGTDVPWMGMSVLPVLAPLEEEEEADEEDEEEEEEALTAFLPLRGDADLAMGCYFSISSKRNILTSFFPK